MYTIYTDDTNRVSIICPKCGFEQKINTTNFKDTQKKLKGRCRCGEPYQYTIEFRKRYRKDVRLSGKYSILGKGEKEEIIIRDLSFTGIRFESLKPHQISSDDTLEVTFKLDNPLRSEIRKLAKVMWVRDRIVGANYIETKLYENDLEFYLKE